MSLTFCALSIRPWLTPYLVQAMLKLGVTPCLPIPYKIIKQMKYKIVNKVKALLW